MNTTAVALEKHQQLVLGCLDLAPLTDDDLSGDRSLLDRRMGSLAPDVEVALGGRCDDLLSFAFPPAFMREAPIRSAAQWLPQDLAAVTRRAESGELSLAGSITDRSDTACLKTILDWRNTP